MTKNHWHEIVEKGINYTLIGELYYIPNVLSTAEGDYNLLLINLKCRTSSFWVLSLFLLILQG